MDRKIIKLLGPNKAYNFYIITWTNFKGRQSLLGFKTYICWDRTAVVHDRTFLTKVIYKFVSTKNSETIWIPNNKGGISEMLVPFTNVFSIFQ